MFEAIISFDKKLFLVLNGHHNAFFDAVMWLCSDIYFWIPLYAWLLWLLYKRYPRRYWMMIITVGLVIAASDQLCNLFKESVMRLRPTHDPAMQSLVHTLNGYTGGMYSFYSGHASNAFAVAAYVLTTLGTRKKFFVAALLGYACITSYSRIYLGVHYPIDILTGAMVGSIIGFGAGFGYKRLYNQLKFKNISNRKHGQ